MAEEVSESILPDNLDEVLRLSEKHDDSSGTELLTPSGLSRHDLVRQFTGRICDVVGRYVEMWCFAGISPKSGEMHELPTMNDIVAFYTNLLKSRDTDRFDSELMEQFDGDIDFIFPFHVRSPYDEPGEEGDVGRYIDAIYNTAGTSEARHIMSGALFSAKKIALERIFRLKMGRMLENVGEDGSCPEFEELIRVFRDYADVDYEKHPIGERWVTPPTKDQIEDAKAERIVGVLYYLMGGLFDSTGRNRKFNHEFSGPDASQEDFENLCRLLVSSGNKDLLLALYARSGGLFGGNDKAGKVFSRFIEDDSGSVVDSPED